jgi:hypothetical protein
VKWGGMKDRSRGPELEHTTLKEIFVSTYMFMYLFVYFIPYSLGYTFYNRGSLRNSPVYKKITKISTLVACSLFLQCNWEETKGDIIRRAIIVVSLLKINVKSFSGDRER